MFPPNNSTKHATRKVVVDVLFAFLFWIRLDYIKSELMAPGEISFTSDPQLGKAELWWSNSWRWGDFFGDESCASKHLVGL